MPVRFLLAQSLEATIKFDLKNVQKLHHLFRCNFGFQNLTALKPFTINCLFDVSRVELDFQRTNRCLILSLF